MSKPNKKSEKKQNAPAPQTNNPWISMRTGFITIIIVSIGMAVYVAWQAVPSVGLWQAILYGLFFGGSIWLVFLGALLFNRFVRRNSSK